MNLSVQNTENSARNDDEVRVGNILDDRYELTEIVGRGGCGIVFRALDLNLQRDVAVKVLSGEGIKESGTLKKFEQESQILRRLHAQNTVYFYDCGETAQKLPYIVMEFVSGRLLKDLLAEEGKLSPKRTVAILTQVFSALEEAHGYGFVHRDLKPGNIMLCDRPGFPDALVKVLDFGIAKIMSKGEVNDPSKMELAGTPKYMPPEQFKNDPLTPSADLYSMGCIAYEMLTGIAPFEGETLHVTIARHLLMTPPSFGPEIEKYPNLVACVFKLLEKQPEARFESAHKVLAVLEHWNEPELIPEMVGCRIKGDDEQKSIFDDDESVVSSEQNCAVSKEVPKRVPRIVPAETKNVVHPKQSAPVANPLRSAQETVLNRSGVSPRELLLLREAGHITKSKERKLIFVASAILLFSIVIIFIALFVTSQNKAESADETPVVENVVEETVDEKQADVVEEENKIDRGIMENIALRSSETVLDAVAFGLLSNEDLLHLNDPGEPEQESDSKQENVESKQVKVVDHHHKAADKGLKFKFTLKYSPSNARVGFLNAKGECPGNGMCKVETTSETAPARVLVSAKGYQPKTVVLSKRVSTLKIDLKAKK